MDSPRQIAPRTRRKGAILSGALRAVVGALRAKIEFVKVRRKKQPKGRDVTKILKGYPPGRWVVFDDAHSRVIADGPSAGEALENADRLGESGILFRVPDPDTVQIY
jgi:hypothetical protein